MDMHNEESRQDVATANIVVVDDEEIVRELLSEILDMLGYTSLAFGSPQHAIDYFSENKDIIDLVIMDMIMPEMMGSQLFEEIIKIKEDQKVIVLSGYSHEQENMNFLEEEGIVGFIQKPVSVSELGEMIAKALHKE